MVDADPDHDTSPEPEAARGPEVGGDAEVAAVETHTARHAAPDDPAVDVQVRAESALVRSGLVGALVGMVLGAGLWALIVLLAIAGSDWSLGPPLLMGVVVGMFAGSFYGGWVGTMIGNREIEAAEHDALPALPEGASRSH